MNGHVLRRERRQVCVHFRRTCGRDEHGGCAGASISMWDRGGQSEPRRTSESEKAKHFGVDMTIREKNASKLRILKSWCCMC
jgi:hypothetical protein